MALVEIHAFHDARCEVDSGKGKAHCHCGGESENQYNLFRVSGVVISFHNEHGAVGPYNDQRNIPTLNYVAHETAKRITREQWRLFRNDNERRSHFLRLFQEETFKFYRFVMRPFFFSLLFP
jgi:hypothetical protein